MPGQWARLGTALVPLPAGTMPDRRIVAKLTRP
jgi:hypothetical protein